jgi:four helix bundle protein
MATYRDLDVLDAADLLADDVNRLLDTSGLRLIHRAQLRDCAGSIGANIAEGMTRRSLEGRNSCLDVSRGEANEAIRHLRANYSSDRIAATTFFALRNRLVTIDKMLVRLQRSRFSEPAVAVARRDHRPGRTTHRRG